MIQGPIGPIGPPGQDGRDGRDGANAPPVTIPQPVQPAPIVQNLNATSLENSFDRVGQNIADVLTEQKVANHRLREQLEANNETLQDQTDAMVALADIARKQSYDHMFAAIPIFDGSQPELFNDWMESIETLCALSGRDPRTKVMGRSGPVVQKTLKSIPSNQKWLLQREELRRCVSDIPTKAHAAQKMQEMIQEPKENLRAFIHRFSNMHYYATGKVPEGEHDMSHMMRFLSAIKNSKIARRITEQRIPDTMTLQDIFMKALDLEAGLQMAESEAQRRDTQVMEMTGDSQHHDDVNEVGPRNGSRSWSPSDVSCWECSQRGHYQRDCPLKAGGIGIPTTVPEGVVGQMQHVFTANSDITNKMMGELYKQLAAAEFKGQVYKRGYRKAKASMAQASTNAASTVTNPIQTIPAQVQMTVPTQAIQQQQTIPQQQIISQQQAIPQQQKIPQTMVIPTSQITSQMIPPSLNSVVQLTRVKQDPDPVSSSPYTIVTRAIKIPRGITDAKTYLASASSSTATTKTTPSTTKAIQTPRSSTQSKDTKTYKKNFTPAGGKNKQYKKTNGCPPLTTIQEVDAEVETESQIDLDVSEAKAEVICSIMNDITDEENIPIDSETEM